MYNFIFILHIVVAFILIISIVAFQTSKGSALSMFGGGGDNLFSANSGTTFIRKFTIGVAIMFGATSILLTILSSNLKMKSVVQEFPLQAAPPSQTQTKTPGAKKDSSASSKNKTTKKSSKPSKK